MSRVCVCVTHAVPDRGKGGERGSMRSNLQNCARAPVSVNYRQAPMISNLLGLEPTRESNRCRDSKLPSSLRMDGAGIYISPGAESALFRGRERRDELTLTETLTNRHRNCRRNCNATPGAPERLHNVATIFLAQPGKRTPRRARRRLRSGKRSGNARSDTLALATTQCAAPLITRLLIARKYLIKPRNGENKGARGREKNSLARKSVVLPARFESRRARERGRGEGERARASANRIASGIPAHKFLTL